MIFLAYGHPTDKKVKAQPKDSCWTESPDLAPCRMPAIDSGTGISNPAAIVCYQPTAALAILADPRAAMADVGSHASAVY